MALEYKMIGDLDDLGDVASGDLIELERSATSYKKDFDAAIESKILELINVYLRPGMIAMNCSDIVPDSWLLCDGKTIGKTGSGADYEGAEYKSLYDFLGNTFGGTYDWNANGKINIPNFKGIFPRGAGSQTIGGQDFSATLGTCSGDKTALPNSAFLIGNEDPVHKHTIATGAFGSSGSTTVTGAANQGTRTSANNGTNHTHAMSGGDSETAPANLGINFVIKY